VVPASQVAPQLPQFVALVARDTQAPLQGVVPVGQTLPLLPVAPMPVSEGSSSAVSAQLADASQTTADAAA